VAQGAASLRHDQARAQVANGYGLWLGYLASTGGLQANDLPCARLDVRRLQGYVADLSSRLAPVSVASRLRDLAEALRVMQPDGDRRLVMLALRRLERTARPSRDLRSRLVAPTTLYEAGIARMERLMQAQDCGPRRRAIRYSDGLRIAMLAAKPVRLKNLAETRLDRHLARVGDVFHWRFAPGETKTRQAIDASLPGRLTGFIDRWVEGYRRDLLKGEAGDALWISLQGGPMGRSAVYQRVCIATEQELGIRINPHAFRAIVATGVAIALPEDVKMIPFLLDHRSDRTATEHYNLADGLSASARYLERLEMRRAEALAKASQRR
jgi:integrase